MTAALELPPARAKLLADSMAAVADTSIVVVPDGAVGFRLPLPPWFAEPVTYKWAKRKGERVRKPVHPIWDPLQANRSRAFGSHHPRVKATRTVREEVERRAGPDGLHLPHGTFLTVALHYRPATGGRRDGGNLAPLQKAIVDGLARGPYAQKYDELSGHPLPDTRPGLDLVPDDDGRYVKEWPPTIVAHDKTRPAIWMDVFVSDPYWP